MNTKSLLALLISSSLVVVTCDAYAHYNHHKRTHNSTSGSSTSGSSTSGSSTSGSCTPGGGTSAGDTSGNGTSSGGTSAGDTSGGGTSSGGTSAGGTINTVQTIIDDMTLPNDAFPHGNPYATAPGGIVEAGNNGQGYLSLTGWGEAYRDTSDSPDTNTRVQVRNYQVWMLSKSTNQWTQLSATASVSGMLYHETWSPGTQNADLVPGVGGGVAVKVPHGWLFHYWPDTSTKSNLVPINADDVAGLFMTVEGRLVVDDPSQTDDRDIAKYVIEVGGDYYSDATYTGTGHHLEIGGGRYKWVTNDWQAFNFITVNPADIAVNSPPLQ